MDDGICIVFLRVCRGRLGRWRGGGVLWLCDQDFTFAGTGLVWCRQMRALHASKANLYIPSKYIHQSTVQFIPEKGEWEWGGGGGAEGGGGGI